MIHIARNIARLVIVQLKGFGSARTGGVKVRWQRLQIEHDGGQRRARRRLVDGSNSGNRLAAVAHTFARQRKFVLRNRDHAIGHIAHITGDDGVHARHGLGAADVDAADARMRQRAAQNSANQRVARGQIGRVARLARDFFDAVDQRLAHTNSVLHVGRSAVFGIHDVAQVGAASAAAAACTDSMILT